MSTLTGGDLNLVKPALTDDHKVTIGTDLPANFQKIDDAFSTHLADKANPHGVTKAQVGLSNVENANIATIRTDSSQKLRAEVKSSAPASPENGDIWYDSAEHKFKGRANGAWV